MGKIARSYDMPRTFGHANAAAHALVIVDRRHVVFDLYGSVLTVLLAKPAADTANVAVLHSHLAVIDRHTTHPVRAVIGNKLDDLLGAGGHTGAALHAARLVLIAQHLDLRGVRRLAPDHQGC